MSWLYCHCVRPLLFGRDSEEIHNQTLRILETISGSELLCDALSSYLKPLELPVTVFGLTFPNPVGLAAGMDKHGTAVPAWDALGFGFSEMGGVTWHAQPGNPPPRLFRIPASDALINRMGFNNPGAELLAVKLAAWRARGRWPDHPVGINLGKSKVTPLDKAAEDYAHSLRTLWKHADFFVVNVSSPNTPNLRQLQDRQALDEILAAVQEANRAQARDVSAAIPRTEQTSQNSAAPKPILVKIAPDLTFEALDEVLALAAPHGLAGIVATNTTVTRPKTEDSELMKAYAEAGGLSGAPLRARSTEVVRHIYAQTKGSLPIIGVGGMFNADDAWEKITAGASLVQVYTGLVYEGPGIALSIVNGLRAKLANAGLKKLEDAVGAQAMP